MAELARSVAVVWLTTTALAVAPGVLVALLLARWGEDFDHRR